MCTQLEIPAWAIRVSASGEVTQQFGHATSSSAITALRIPFSVSTSGGGWMRSRPAEKRTQMARLHPYVASAGTSNTGKRRAWRQSQPRLIEELFALFGE